MKILTLTHDREEVNEPPKLTRHTNNPLKHRNYFEPGDALRAIANDIGLAEGVDYPILGYWFSEKDGLYAYLPGNSILKAYRFANTEDRLEEEVLFTTLPAQITEICVTDCLNSLAFIPATDTEPVMRVSHRAPKEQEQEAVLFDPRTKQISLFNVA